MPSNRPNLTLDEQFFQELLSAAFTIQQHNDSLESAEPIAAIPVPEPEPKHICPQCGGAKPSAAAPCEHCGPEGLRPGEQMQRKWASMWLMSQQQGLWPERAAADEVPDAAHSQDHHAKEHYHQQDDAFAMKRDSRAAGAHDFAASGILKVPFHAGTENHSGAPPAGEIIPDVLSEPSIDDALRREPANGDGQSNGRKNGDRAGEGQNLPPKNGHALYGSLSDDDLKHLFVSPEVELEESAPASNWLLADSHNDSAHDVPRNGSPANGSPLHGSGISGSPVSNSPRIDLPRDEPLPDESVPPEVAAGYFLPPFGDSVDSDSADSSAAAEASNVSETNIGLLEEDTTSLSLASEHADWRVKLRFHRADVYLGLAICVAAVALLWPTVGSPQQSSLSTWQRALITLGIAEAPQPATHLQGDPAVEVWIDTHSALYYCPGEEQYGKTPGGRFTSQREAEMDRFEPAGRLACE